MTLGIREGIKSKESFKRSFMVALLLLLVREAPLTEGQE